MKRMTRRDVMKLMSAAGFGTLIFSTRIGGGEPAAAPAAVEGAGFMGRVIAPTGAPRGPARLVDGTVVQPERTLPVIHQTDVLVVGGGTAGVMAAVAAKRAGVSVAIAERYGCFGGLWTGGMVLVVIGTHAKVGGEKRKVIRGLGDELLQRIAKLDHGAIDYGGDAHNPTTDPEATKLVMDDMIREAGVNVFFHSWGVEAIMDGPAVRGAVFESKAGRQAILAKVVIDAAGDGDIFASAGADYIQRTYAVGTVHRLGNMDRLDREKMKASGRKLPPLGSATPIPGVTWINTRGPKANAIDVADLSRLEMEHRRNIWNQVQQIRQTPGGEQVYLLDTAPQLGVRISRVLEGMYQLTYKETREGKRFPDTVAVGGAQNANHTEWPIPYGVLLPKKVENLIVTGRSVSADEKLLDDTRLIGACLLTGQAAGAAAAVAVRSGCRPRDVEIPRLQKLLTEQGAYLG